MSTSIILNHLTQTTNLTWQCIRHMTCYATSTSWSMRA